MEPTPLESPWDGGRGGSKCLRALGPGKQPLGHLPRPGHRVPWTPGSPQQGPGTLTLGAARTALSRPPSTVRCPQRSHACLTWRLLASEHRLRGPLAARGSQASGQVTNGHLWAVRSRSYADGRQCTPRGLVPLAQEGVRMVVLHPDRVS